MYSDQAGIGLPIAIRQSDGTLDSTKIKITSRNISDSRYAIDIVSLVDLEGTIPLFGRYSLSNKTNILEKSIALCMLINLVVLLTILLK